MVLLPFHLDEGHGIFMNVNEKRLEGLILSDLLYVRHHRERKEDEERESRRERGGSDPARAS